MSRRISAPIRGATNAVAAPVFAPNARVAPTWRAALLALSLIGLGLSSACDAGAGPATRHTVVAAASAPPSDAMLPNATLPQQYSLDALSLRIERSFGHGQPSQTLTLSGKGQAVLQAGRPVRELPFSLGDQALVEFVNGLYRLHFFDLPAVIHAAPTVFLKPDGSLGTQTMVLSDAGSVSVCFKLPAYQKCVQFVESSGPRELQAWVKTVMDDAVKRTSAAGAGK